MRILHTSDWHMNDRLGRQDRSADICHALEKIAQYLEEGQVDVMIVSGDLFSDASSREQLRDALADLHTIFSPFLQRNGTIVAIRGNHDPEWFFETMRNAHALITPLPNGIGSQSVQASGRFYFAPRPRVLPLADKEGNIVQFVLMPYPSPSCYLRVPKINYGNVEERHRAIQSGFTDILGLLQSEKNFDTTQPSVLVSHVHVRGSEVHSLYKITEMESVIFEQSDIPAGWAYAAYGHIHKPQTIAGADHIRYAGSIERLDGGEYKDEKSVVLFEIDSSNRISTLELLPLESTPLHHIQILNPEQDIARLPEMYPDSNRALVKYTLHWDPQKHNRDELCREIERIFPRWYSRDFQEIGTDALHERAWTAERMQDVTTTVRDYLQTQLAGDPRCEELLKLADELLTEEGCE